MEHNICNKLLAYNIIPMAKYYYIYSLCLWHIIEEHDNVRVKLKTKRVDVIIFCQHDNVKVKLKTDISILIKTFT